MDSLITIIGNAVLDTTFMSRLLEDPVKAMDDWHFRLTKFEAGTLEEMFANLSAQQKQDLTVRFESLHTMLYQNCEKAAQRAVLLCHTKKCQASLQPSDEKLRTQWKEEARKQATKAA